mmetsp:Transcript_23595/g.54934  ORF Transcript_23595/g.54934 Transcript_23595/m.54934 type:complete len:390 (+) Transcript_23595:75-1244(+)
MPQGLAQWTAIAQDVLGHSPSLDDNVSSTVNTTTSLQSYGGWKFPEIPEGAATVIIPVAFPVTSTPIPPVEQTVEAVEVMIICVIACIIIAAPMLCINKRICCSCFNNCISRWMKCYFFYAVLVAIALVSLVIAYVPHITANGLFFAVVHLVEVVTDHLEDVLTQLVTVCIIIAIFLFRKKFIELLGIEGSLVNADVRDVLTCFSMTRFNALEVSLWKAEHLPAGFGQRTLYVRMILGYNEAQHSRPHDGCTNSFSIRENFNLNYDPEDDTQKMAIIIKEQEVVGHAVSQLAPAAGALFGGLATHVLPVQPVAGVGVGVVAGIGAANSVGKEVARVEMSSAQINRLLGANTSKATASRATMRWADEDFVKVDMVPQGELWLKLAKAETV